MDEIVSCVQKWFAKVNSDVTVYEVYLDDLGTDKIFAHSKADKSNI